MMPLYTCAFEAIGKESSSGGTGLLYYTIHSMRNSLLFYSVVNFDIKASKTTLISRFDLHKNSLHPLKTGRRQ